jgi:hypothetical protein
LERSKDYRVTKKDLRDNLQVIYQRAQNGLSQQGAYHLEILTSKPGIVMTRNVKFAEYEKYSNIPFSTP